MDWNERILSNAEVCHGKPCFVLGIRLIFIDVRTIDQFIFARCLIMKILLILLKKYTQRCFLLNILFFAEISHQ
jgi:hypothetical protein